jgi:hypothetical protein
MDSCNCNEISAIIIFCNNNMKKHIYFYILISIVILLWVIYFIKYYSKEGFTPKINGTIRPYMRNIRNGYEHFTNNYGSNVIMTKLRKYNIY